MNGYRPRWLAVVAVAGTLIGCGGTSPAPSPSPSPSPTPLDGTTGPGLQVGPTVQITFSGGVTGAFTVNPTQSQCSVLPSGGFSAQFDGVVPGSTAALTIQVQTGTHPVPVASDAVNLDTNGDDWASVVSGSTTILVTGRTVAGMVQAVVADKSRDVIGTVANLQVSGSFNCTLSGSGSG